LQPLDTNSVKEWRHRRMLSQQEVADRAGTSLFTIQRIERGEGNVRPKTGRAVAAALGVPIEELLPKAQAPLWSEEAPERRPFDFHEARESLEEYCERWERLIEGGGLNDQAINEFMATGQGWIPVLDVALRAELGELRKTTRLEGSELLQRSEIAHANERYLAVFSEIARILSRLVKAAGVPADNVVVLEEARERLAGMPMRAVG
jgi:transcriptional regulator with XRE-family HTH domain